jgi:hypothetical protein
MPVLILRESLAAIKRVRGEARFRRRLRKFSATSQEPPSARAPRNHVMITLGTISDLRVEPAAQLPAMPFLLLAAARLLRAGWCFKAPVCVSHPKVEAERARSSHARIASGPHPVNFSGLPVGGDHRDEVTAIDSPARGCTACGDDWRWRGLFVVRVHKMIPEWDNAG